MSANVETMFSVRENNSLQPPWYVLYYCQEAIVYVYLSD